jgi:hypothetical protein
MICFVDASFLMKKKKKLHGLSPRANYTDRATAGFLMKMYKILENLNYD